MADALKMVAALVKEYPEHAGLVLAQATDGKGESEIRSAVAALVAGAAVQVANAERDEAAASAAKANGELKAVKEALAAAEKDRDEWKAKHEALAALGAGAAKAEEVAADGEDSSAADFDKMTPQEKAKHYAKLAAAPAAPKK